MSWTDERVELLRKLWLEGMSASRIASELGAGITRNAVIGKVHRLGVSGRAKDKLAETKRRARRVTLEKDLAARAEGRRRRAALANRLPDVRIAVAKSECVIIIVSERMTIIELQAGMCRFPLGCPKEPEFRFCEAAAVAGPYCDGHRQMAYMAGPDRRADKRLERAL